MLSKKITTNLILIFVFIIAFFVVRISGIAYDAINPDGVNWHFRAEQFIVGLKTKNPIITYQHYHPGVTLMWIVGSIVEIFRQIYPTERVYNHINFMMFQFVSKLALVVVQGILTAILLFVLSKILKLLNVKYYFLIALFSVSLFSLEPFFVGNSRLVHLDVLLSLFLFIGLCYSYLYTRETRLINIILSAFFLALAFLTKSVGIVALLYVLLTNAVILLRNYNFKKAVWNSSVMLLVYIITLVVFFPALWVEFFGTLINIFDEAERVGGRKGHGQILLGEYTRDPGVSFYILVILMKMSPLLILGMLLNVFRVSKESLFKTKYILSSFKNIVSYTNLSFIAYLAVFYIGYIVLMTIPSKKIDRYMLPIYPFFSLIAVYGYYFVYSKLIQKLGAWGKYIFILVLSLLTAVFLVTPLVKIFPYYFTYTSPLFGTTKNANNIIAQKSFGVGIPALKDFILENYGNYPSLGFIDTKPMRMIYMSSRIFDIRISGTRNYDLIVLGINEEFPENVVSSGANYILDNVIKINGLDYWRIYVKTSGTQAE